MQGAYAHVRGGSSTANLLEQGVEHFVPGVRVERFVLRSGWFKHLEPPRPFSNHILTELARCGAFCRMRSGWFDCTEPSLATLLQGKQGVQGSYTRVRGGSSTSNLLKPSRTTSSQR